MNICPNCQAKLNQSSRFCTICGTKIDESLVKEKSNENLNHKKERLLDIFRKDLGIEIFNKQPNQSITNKELSRFLKIIEKKKGFQYEEAKRELITKRPLEAINPLWQLSKKVFLPENKKKDIYDILGAIGTTKVVNLITSEKPFLDENSLDYIKILLQTGKEFPMKWLASLDINDINLKMRIYAILMDENDSGVIPELLDKTSFYYYEEPAQHSSGKISLLGLVAGAAKEYSHYQQNEYKKLNLSSLATNPELSVTELENSHGFIQAYKEATMRYGVIKSLMNNNFIENNKNDFQKDFSKEIFFVSCLLRSNIPNSFLGNIMSKVNSRNKKNAGTSNQLAIIFLAESLIISDINQNSTIHSTQINSLLNFQDKVIKNGIASSILYLNYSPLIEPAINSQVIKYSIIPPLVYSSQYYDNNIVDSTIQNIIINGSKDDMEYLGIWQDFFRNI